jgi:hypothetical protein
MTITKVDNYKNFNTSIIDRHLAIYIETDTLWSHETLYEVIADAINQGVKYILIDKRNHITACSPERIDNPTCRPIGKCLKEHDVKLAVVLNKDDHMEKIACYEGVKYGAKVLSTESFEEAVYWLNGLLS